MKALVATLALLLTFACAGQAPKAIAKPVSATSPAPAVNPPTGLMSTPAPAPAAPVEPAAPAPVAAPALALSGALAANVMHTSVANPCARIGGSYYVKVTFSVAGAEYALTLTISSYSGPHAYSAPPARVSMRPLASSQPVLYTGVSGRVVVDGDERSGTISENLESQSDKIHVDGSWRCP